MAYYKEVIDDIITRYNEDKTVPIISNETEEEILTIWQKIIKEGDDKIKEIEKYKLSKANLCQLVENPVVKSVRIDLLILLQKALEETLAEAIATESLETQKTIFNGIDHIAQLLWNLNPRYPERKENNLYIHDMEWATEWLEQRPRPYFPLSWLLTKTMAATKLQSYVRGYLVRKRADVQEMRNFWKVIKATRDTERITFCEE